MIYYSNNYDLEKRLQSEDRAHHIGQTGGVTYVDLVAENTIDDRIIKSLENKINIANEIMGEDIKIGSKNLFDKFIFAVFVVYLVFVHLLKHTQQSLQHH